MSYALIVEGVIVSEGAYPGDEALPAAEKQAAGYWEVVSAARPPDTASVTYTRALALVGGIPTESWVQRAKTAAELERDTQAANEATIRAAMVAAVATNVNHIAIASPSVAQNTAQIKALSRQNNHLIRMALRLLDATT